MDSNLSLYEDKLKFYFVSTDGNAVSQAVQFAREKISQNVSAENIVDVTPAECLELAKTATIKDIIIFEEFKGECFLAVSKTKALVLGPRSVISCFMDNVSIPNIRSPIYTLAMRNLIVSLSSFKIPEKHKLSQMINFMGGQCIDNLTENVTHLVTDNVLTKKYEIAAIRNMNIMKSDWLAEVWKVSCEDNILATHERFDQYRVPIFYNLALTTSGINRKEKSKVQQLVEANGGKYYGEYNASVINIVIANRNTEITPKIRAAISANISCLTIEWVLDSIEKGFALPLEEYRILCQDKPIASTPDKLSSSKDRVNFNYTNISEMSNVPYVSSINETLMSDTSQLSMNIAMGDTKDHSYINAFEKLSVQEAKKANTFLDGCSIFVCGFGSEEKEKIFKILNAGGATRYDTINSNVSHILIGKPTKRDIAMLHTVKTDVALLKLEWLVESIAKRNAITDFERFLYRLSTGGKSNDLAEEAAAAPSPASKRNILSMTGGDSSSKQKNRKRLEFDDDANLSATAKSSVDGAIGPNLHDNDNLGSVLLDQYLKPTTAAKNVDDNMFKAPQTTVAPNISPVSDLSASISSNSHETRAAKAATAPSANTLNSECSFTFSSENLNFLTNLTVHIRGFDDESLESLVNDCKMAGANVIQDDSYDGTVDYLILAMDILTMDGINVKAKNIVNHNWLINAKRMNQIIDIPYFFKPIFFSEELKPLATMVIVFSLYVSDERCFLVQLAEILGAVVEDAFRKLSRPLLICPTPDNAKYKAAIKWNLAVVSGDWLMECYRRQKRVAMKKYLVGDSILPVEYPYDGDDDDDEDKSEDMFKSASVLNVPAIKILEDNVNPNRNDKPQTPVILDRRVAELRPKTPAADKASPSHAVADKGPDEYFSSLNTPMRESIKQAIKEAEDETPESKRRRHETGGYRTPEFATTPYLLEKKRAFLEERRTKYLPTESQTKKKVSTPWTEYKRRFWKEALGDEYESPSQCYTANTQAFTQLNESVTGPRQLTYEHETDVEADENIKKLSDFIKNRGSYNNQTVEVASPVAEPPHTEDEMPNSEQYEAVGWRDPSEVIARPAPQPFSTMRFKGTPCFSISSQDEDLRTKTLSQIRSLNGLVCEDLVNYDKKCTHLVCERPNRGEKIWCCISAGKWVLGIDYIQKSFDAGHFLDEELFEWGNPKATSLPTLEPKFLQIAKAVYRLRKKAHTEATSFGVFKEFRVILKTSKNTNIRALIEAGNGEVIQINPDEPLNKQLDALIDATHIICQPKVTKFTNDEIAAFKQFNVHCVNISYLNAYITDETTPDLKSFLIK